MWFLQRGEYRLGYRAKGFHLVRAQDVRDVAAYRLFVVGFGFLGELSAGLGYADDRPRLSSVQFSRTASPRCSMRRSW